jgi:hypothetical protein
MLIKLKALLTILTYQLGLNRSSNRSFRRNLADRLLIPFSLKNSEKIILSTRYLCQLTKTNSHRSDQDPFPLSDAEREYMKAVLIYRLPSHYRVEKHYNEEEPLTHQLTYHFIKTTG